MFKSIFSKYLTTFTVILLSCILAIIASVTVVTVDDMRSAQYSTMRSVAGSVAAAIEAVAKDMSFNSVDETFTRSGTVKSVIAAESAGSGSLIYVFGADGRFVGASAGIPEKDLSPAAVNKMFTVSDSYAVSTVEGLYNENMVNIYRVGNVNGERYIVLVSDMKLSRGVMDKKMVLVAVTVSLWVFLAAMISLYVISRRTTRPLSQIVQAAKGYAKGRFDQKIEVSGQDEVAELAKAINEMASSLAHIEEVRNSFIGNVSHDLRTPMTTIAGFVDGILDGTIPPENREYYLNIISSEVRRLSRLVNSLLEMSRMESGASLNFVDFNLTEKARNVLISFEKKIDAKKLDIEFDGGDEDLFVNADADSIHRVIFNLIDNAIKFTPEGGKITVKVESVADGRRKRKARFSIRNTGDGIPSEELPHIFERFYKTDRSRGLDKTGTGLGLYIAKTSLVNHGEDLAAESVAGEYTEFSFSLRLAETKEK